MEQKMTSENNYPPGRGLDLTISFLESAGLTSPFRIDPASDQVNFRICAEIPGGVSCLEVQGGIGATLEIPGGYMTFEAIPDDEEEINILYEFAELAAFIWDGGAGPQISPLKKRRSLGVDLPSGRGYMFSRPFFTVRGHGAR